MKTGISHGGLLPQAFCFSKIWQVYDWLANWFIMFGFMDLRRQRVARRSNVGLVNCCCCLVVLLFNIFDLFHSCILYDMVMS